MKLNKKTKQELKKKLSPHSLISKRELAQLKTLHKSGTLKFDSKGVAKAILEDKDIRHGLTK